ncbi:hypothetical protein [Limnohabitans sp. 2KL-17]|uniref:hypothetical protein n=1 Tax=Limnohabitans sp. 2KL-17 TaxID=1100704 RepID=UPI0011B2162B|nr:hypothetical protein [Limnohabitans sp. 2KL-17]
MSMDASANGQAQTASGYADADQSRYVLFGVLRLDSSGPEQAKTQRPLGNTLLHHSFHAYSMVSLYSNGLVMKKNQIRWGVSSMSWEYGQMGIRPQASDFSQFRSMAGLQRLRSVRKHVPEDISRPEAAVRQCLVRQQERAPSSAPDVIGAESPFEQV